MWPAVQWAPLAAFWAEQHLGPGVGMPGFSININTYSRHDWDTS